MEGRFPFHTAAASPLPFFGTGVSIVPMPLAIALRLDLNSGSVFEEMWRALAVAGIDADRHQLGYAAHITLAIYPDETPIEQLRSGLARVAGSWRVLPVTMAGFGVFPGASSILWAAPIVSSELLARHAELQSALTGLPVHPHYRSGTWVPHVTLSGALRDPGRALAVLIPRWQPVSGILDQLDLVRFRPVEELHSYRLQG